MLRSAAIIKHINSRLSQARRPQSKGTLANPYGIICQNRRACNWQPNIELRTISELRTLKPLQGTPPTPPLRTTGKRRSRGVRCRDSKMPRATLINIWSSVQNAMRREMFFNSPTPVQHFICLWSLHWFNQFQKKASRTNPLKLIPGRSTGCRNHWNHRDHHHRCLASRCRGVTFKCHAD